MSEWIEQPAFETNEFKIGDFVRIYKGTGIEEEEVISVSSSHVCPYGGGEYHFQQCRLLKKREPREWWVAPGFADNEYFEPYQDAQISKKEVSGWVKVREVI